MKIFIKKIIHSTCLQLLYCRHKCKIYSWQVAYQAIKGSHINVQSETQIDKFSSVGSYTYVGRFCNITASRVGRYVSIANNVLIGQGGHDLDRISTSSIFYNDPWNTLTQRKCIIESDVWIGVDVIVLRGVTIGVGAVVGANSVVTKDVPPYAIVAGSPARILRYRFSNEKIIEVIASAWWKKDPDEASLVHRQLEDTKK